MTDERKAQLKAIRAKLASLSTDERERLTSRGLIATIEGRTLSTHNTILLAIQARQMPTVVGGYNQWKAAGRQVKHGEHGLTMWFPVGEKDKDGNVTAEKFFTTTVFDVSQTEAITGKAAIVPIKEQPEPQRQAPAPEGLMAGWQPV